jgi:hypothetical protein
MPPKAHYAIISGRKFLLTGLSEMNMKNLQVGRDNCYCAPPDATGTLSPQALKSNEWRAPAPFP